MVRTKADAAVRVAAGGKAPKKTGNSHHSPSPSPTEKCGKDSFPVNKYCPRETPNWQKKITNFFNGNVKSNESPESPDTTKNQKVAQEQNNNARKKRNSSVLDESDEMEADEVEISSKKFKSNIGMETNLEQNAQGQIMEMEE